MNTLFQSCEERPDEMQLKIKGFLPNWLKGSLIRIGPGKWDMKDGFSMNHFLDGCAFLVKFRIEDGAVHFSSRFLKSEAYLKMMAFNRPVFTEFGTRAYPDPSKNIFSRFVSQIVPSDLTDNDISNIYNLHGEIFVATESCNDWRIDPETLESKEKVNIDKQVGVNITCSHPHHSDVDGTTYNIGMSFMTGMRYHVIKVPSPPAKPTKGTRGYSKASILATVPCSYKTRFSYIHSFATTNQYIIFIEQPLLVNAFKLAACTSKGMSMNDCLEWQPNETSKFHIIVKSTGAVVTTKYQSEPFFLFHHINAYEEADQIVLDLVTYENSAILEKFQMKKLRNNEWNDECPPRPHRFVIPLKLPVSDVLNSSLDLITVKNCEAKAKLMGNVVHLTPTLLGPSGFELPVINSSYNAKKYRFVYGCGVFERGFYANAIAKLNVTTKEVKLWRESATAYPGEAIFIPKPGAVYEDDGLIASLVLEADVNKPHFLVILDAKNFRELGRAIIQRDPQSGSASLLPPTLHGIFLPK